MSTSSLWVMNEEYNGFEIEEYKNSYLFSPIIWNVLLDKYMHDEIQTPYGYKKSLIGMEGPELSIKLNKIINECDNMSDRICWELSNQQVFFAKDQVVVAEAIRTFLTENTSFYITNEGRSMLEAEHIKERFEEIANGILEIDDEKYPHFIFKNSSVDDTVQSWFFMLDEEEEDYYRRPLHESRDFLAEFVLLEDGNMSFQSNLSYFEDLKIKK